MPPPGFEHFRPASETIASVPGERADFLHSFAVFLVTAARGHGLTGAHDRVLSYLRIVRRLRLLISLPPASRRLHLEALALTAAVRFALWTLPTRRVLG